MREKYLSFLLFLLVAAGCHGHVEKNIAITPGVGYSNGTAEEQMVNLPDGSRIIIGSGTTLVPSKGFGKEDRDLGIDGSGMFEVVAGEKPFVVLTGNLVITVLDTTGVGRSGIGADRSGAGQSGTGGSGDGGSGDGAGGWKIRFAVDAVRKRPGEEVDLLDGRLRVTKSYHSDTDSLPEELTAGDMVMINREIDLMEKEKMTGPEEDKVKEKYHLAAH
jgi:transmembrane sensor